VHLLPFCPADKLRRRFLPQRKSLAAVIADDARLAGMSEAEILAEVRAQVRWGKTGLLA
jgi:hypothetical protein